MSCGEHGFRRGPCRRAKRACTAPSVRADGKVAVEGFGKYGLHGPVETGACGSEPLLNALGNREQAVEPSRDLDLLFNGGQRDP